jgi:hypothetical protein
MILLYPPGAERLRRARKNVAEGRFNSPIRRLVRGYVERQQVDEAMLKGVLHLNARNALLRRVRDLGPAHPQFAPLVSILVANARVFAGQGLSAQETIACFEQVNRSLSRLVGLDLGEDGALSVALLAELGLSQEAAGRLCAACETAQALLDADVATLAERTRLSPLMLATIREELKARQARGTTQSAGTTASGATQATTATESESESESESETAPDGDGRRRKPKIVALRDRKARPAGDESAGSTDAGGDA